MVVALFVARESLLIHMDEVEKKSISQMLDRKVYLNIDSQGFVTEEVRESAKETGANPLSEGALGSRDEDE